jgi:hypothetical protein
MTVFCALEKVSMSSARSRRLVYQQTVCAADASISITTLCYVVLHWNAGPDPAAVLLTHQHTAPVSGTSHLYLISHIVVSVRDS